MSNGWYRAWVGQAPKKGSVTLAHRDQRAITIP